jgi:ABC-type transport system involved in cytochrome c biogenesis permease component
MLEAVTSGLTEVIGWVGTVVSALTTEAGELHALLPLLAIGIAVSALMLGVKAIRSFTWGA